MNHRDQSLGIILFATVIVLVQAKHRWNAVQPSFLRKSPPFDESQGKLFTSSSPMDWRHRVSGPEGEDCELVVQNDLSEPILLCWVSPSGQLLGHRKINDRSIRDKSVSNMHTEYTYAGHAFVCLRYPQGSPPDRLQDVDPQAFLAHYTPNTHAKHILTIGKGFWGGLLATVSTERVDDEVVDSSAKVYELVYMGGFAVHCEPGVFANTPTLEEVLTKDIETMSAILPQAAKQRLQASTPIWLNRSLIYGPKSAPIDEQKAMFHPHGEEIWLRKNGLNVAKAGGVEICNARDYLQSRGLWGPGGILVHEFCHAYHNKFCPDGFDCVDICNAYKLAMSKGLYDAVAVHGPQGRNGPIKHYACSNHMEFFAELSVAYHWKEDSEYNKWYPFNHQQLQEHDPDTCRVMDKYWLL